MQDSFWAKVSGSHYGSPWHIFIDNGIAMVPRCGHKYASGPPSRKRMKVQPKMGHICKFCSETAKNGHKNTHAVMRTFAASDRAIALFQEGKFLREIAAEIDRSISTTKCILYKECKKRGLNYDAYIAANQIRYRKERHERREPKLEIANQPGSSEAFGESGRESPQAEQPLLAARSSHP